LKDTATTSTDDSGAGDGGMIL